MALDGNTARNLGLSDVIGQENGAEAVVVPSEPTKFSEGASITPLEDGAELIDFNPLGDEKAPVDHDDNLAEHMLESDLNTLAADIIDWVKEDLDSRQDWDSLLAQGLTYLGLKIEDRNYPFPGAAGVYDPILLEAVIRWHATASAELLPAGGPVKTQIVGNASAETEAQASRVKEFMNFYLMVVS